MGGASYSQLEGKRFLNVLTECQLLVVLFLMTRGLWS